MSPLLSSREITWRQRQPINTPKWCPSATFDSKKQPQEEVSKGPDVKNSESNWSGFTLRTNCDLHKSWHFNWMENDLTPFFFLIGSLHSFKPQRNCMVKMWRVGWRARNRDVKTMSIIGLLPHSTPSYLVYDIRWDLINYSPCPVSHFKDRFVIIMISSLTSSRFWLMLLLLPCVDLSHISLPCKYFVGFLCQVNPAGTSMPPLSWPSIKDELLQISQEIWGKTNIRVE